MADRFEYRQAEELAAALSRHGAKYLFLGKSGAILLGFPDTTQDADAFLKKSPENGEAAVLALKDLGFPLDAVQEAEIRRGKDFIQVRSGPFDVDLVFAPDGIEDFEAADRRASEVEGMRVCALDDIIRSKEAAGRVKDKEVLPRLKGFRDWLKGRSR